MARFRLQARLQTGCALTRADSHEREVPAGFATAEQSTPGTVPHQQRSHACRAVVPRRTDRVGVVRTLLLATGFVLVGTAAVWLSVPQDDLGSDPIFRHRQSSSMRVVAAGGETLYEAPRRGGAWQRWVPFEEISPTLIDAVIAAEDHRIGRHLGIDPVAVVRALMLVAVEGELYSGASTLAMQLARIVDPSIGRDLVGKLRQARLALALERAMSKQEIVEAWLNLAPFGHNRRGVESGAQFWFGVSARKLTLAQAAALAALPRWPTGYDPRRHPARLQTRRNHILGLMHRRGMIEDAELERARDQPIVTTRPPRRALVAGHATMEALHGSTVDESVSTAIDVVLQRRVEAAVDSRLGDRDVDAAVVVADRQGAIVALMGSRDFRRSQYDATRARRPAGDMLWPLAATVLVDQGWTLADPVPDIPVLARYDATTRRPVRNVDRRHLGPTPLRDALSRQRRAGLFVALREHDHEVVARLADLGLSRVEAPAAATLPLRLWDGPVSLRELVGAYNTLANHGRHRQLRLGRHDDTPIDVLDGASADLVLRAIADEAFHGYGGRALPFPAAVVTASSDFHRNHWGIAVTSSFVVGVWLGQIDGSPVGRNVPLDELVADLTRSTADRLPPGPLHHDESAEVSVCALSGARPGPVCPVRHEVIAAGDVPRHTCSWHQTVAVDIRNGLLATETCSPGFVESHVVWVLPALYADWVARENLEIVTDQRSWHCPTNENPDGLVVNRPSGDLVVMPASPPDILSRNRDHDEPRQIASALREPVPQPTTAPDG